MNLQDKLAVVTGASKGIGLATAEALLDNGAFVAAWSRTSLPIHHPRLIHYITDVANADSVEDSFLATVSDFGRGVDVLVNNAGLGYEAPMEELPMKQWKEMFSVNVDGIFYCSRLVIPGMKERKLGHIINISSIAGTNGIPNMAAYCATKHAVRGLSQSMFKELRAHGIKVTCIYPGSVKTNFFDKIDSVTLHDNMMMPTDIASTIVHCLESSGNYHHVDIEVRPLNVKG
jgi:NADP-dependent 3-hydroxy acid dehydrogenase YdfG